MVAGVDYGAKPGEGFLTLDRFPVTTGLHKPLPPLPPPGEYLRYTASEPPAHEYVPIFTPRGPR